MVILTVIGGGGFYNELLLNAFEFYARWREHSAMPRMVIHAVDDAAFDLCMAAARRPSWRSRRTASRWPSSCTTRAF